LSSPTKWTRIRTELHSLTLIVAPTIRCHGDIISPAVYAPAGDTEENFHESIARICAGCSVSRNHGGVGRGTDSQEQIRFGKGRSGTTITGMIKGYQTVDYKLRAGEGQDKAASKGYMGHDEFSVLEGVLGRCFPLYRDTDTNARPTGGMRQIQYKLVPGEAGWILKIDRVVKY
jgi:hypothetical protein